MRKSSNYHINERTPLDFKDIPGYLEKFEKQHPGIRSIYHTDSTFKPKVITKKDEKYLREPFGICCGGNKITNLCDACTRCLRFHCTCNETADTSTTAFD